MVKWTMRLAAFQGYDSIMGDLTSRLWVHHRRPHFCAVSGRSCVMQKDDEDGKLGMKIGRDLMSVAGKALRVNIMTLGPRVLPLSEKLIYAGNLVARKARHFLVISSSLCCGPLRSSHSAVRAHMMSHA